jgi:nicotinamidase-related amidase
MNGSWNADIYEPLKTVVQAEDVYCNKNRLSGMWSEDQPLRRCLQSSGKRTLLFAGVNTDRCVLGTVADAAYAGWDCVVIEDCCATATIEAHEVCIANIEVSDGKLLWYFGLRSGFLFELWVGSRVTSTITPPVYTGHAYYDLS